MGGEKKKKKEEKEVKISDIFGGSLNILGMKIDIGKLLSLAERPGKIAEDLEKLRRELEKAGDKPVRVGGYIRTRPIIGARAPEWRPGERRKREIKTIYVEGEAEEPERPVDIFDEGNKVRVLAEIPSHYKQEELKFEYQKKNGEGELIIRAPEDYERRISIKEELAAGLTGKVELRSFKSGIVNAELEKK
ncbi:MAG: hypothetical protein QME59_05495 [Candidatus Hydrothermarchaeota archaeon]|nr:hypothetical protein [Candidatus Hydrothermarchaeota archaeon]